MDIKIFTTEQIGYILKEHKNGEMILEITIKNQTVWLKIKLCYNYYKMK